MNFDTPPEGEHHKCESVRHGDWVVFTCPRCKEYERRVNWRTGKMTSKGARPDVYHTGNYFPYEYRDAFENVN